MDSHMEIEAANKKAIDQYLSNNIGLYYKTVYQGVNFNHFKFMLRIEKLLIYLTLKYIMNLLLKMAYYPQKLKSTLIINSNLV